MTKNKIPIFIIVLSLIFAQQVNAFPVKHTGKVGRVFYNYAKIFFNPKVFTNKQIRELAKLPGKKLGLKLGKLKLSNKVLEDTFMRIAIHNKKITRKEAEGLFARLSGKPGFRSTLKKIIGNNPSGAKGHLNELKIADNAAISGFKVLGIGEKFKDPLKKGLTDIDIVFKKGNRTFIVEAKAYAKEAKINIINYKKDLNTLSAYKKAHKNIDIVPIFSFTEKPSKNSRYLTILKNEAKKRNIELIFGQPYGQIEQIKLLDKIL